MAEFCACGSLIIDGNCTSKNCSCKTETKAAAKKAVGTGLDNSDKKTAKPPKTRRASKCITYKLEDLNSRNENS